MSTTLIYAGENPQGTSTVQSVEGTSFTIVTNTNQMTINGYPVTTANIMCSNGVLHLINQVSNYMFQLMESVSHYMAIKRCWCLWTSYRTSE